MWTSTSYDRCAFTIHYAAGIERMVIVSSQSLGKSRVKLNTRSIKPFASALGYRLWQLQFRSSMYLFPSHVQLCFTIIEGAKFVQSSSYLVFVFPYADPPHPTLQFSLFSQPVSPPPPHRHLHQAQHLVNPQPDFPALGLQQLVSSFDPASPLPAPRPLPQG